MLKQKNILKEYIIFELQELKDMLINLELKHKYKEYDIQHALGELSSIIVDINSSVLALITLEIEARIFFIHLSCQIAILDMRLRSVVHVYQDTIIGLNKNIAKLVSEIKDLEKDELRRYDSERPERYYSTFQQIKRPCWGCV